MGSRPILKFRASQLVYDTVEGIAEQENTSRSEVLREFLDRSLYLYHPDTTIEDVFTDEMVENLDLDPGTPFRDVVDTSLKGDND